MLSRAHLLILREQERFQINTPWGIEAQPLSESNIFEWSATICGLQGSPWEGGVFRLYIKFTDNFNYEPPDVCFHTIPFHPNVDVITGKPCIDFLDDLDSWNTEYSLEHILLAVQVMLSYPVLENAINPDATKLLVKAPETYNQIVQECIHASQRVQAGFEPHYKIEPFQREVKTAAPQEPLEPVQISFEEYHKTWQAIATSKSDPKDRNFLMSRLKEDPKFRTVHYGLPLDTLQAQLNQQIDEHNALMYGDFKPRSKKTMEKTSRLGQIQKMREIYLPSKWDKTAQVQARGAKLDEPTEDDVDDLVKWSNNLDLGQL